ncbi:autotransporter-associated beta strand repeat-containing protein [Verrucomicrobium sp. BvORR034]|uniref:autotransporter-associated beta strand repeat-containing protein n=1 Tax=Verrucomicrobium sp. BvORR034 TaxID=1396418 RepID=UPI0006794C52|nr:autotransporter-associated beta strand repeat-containing protein [Verrucomicrobium sp. BvORR034]
MSPSRLSLIIAGLASCASLLPAATLVWDGGDVDDSNWSSGDNWVGNVAPANPALPTAPDIIQFAGSTRTTPTTDAAWNVDTLHFNASTASFQLSGQTLTFQPSNGTSHDDRYFLVNNSGTLQTINNNIVVKNALTGTSLGSGISVGSGSLILNGNLDINGISALRFQNATGSGSVTINGVISGTPVGAIAVNSGATAIFNNVNTYVQGTIVWNGTLKLGASSLNGQAGSLGNSSSSVTMGHASSPGARLLTSAAVTIGRDVHFVKNTGNNAYTVGGDSAHVSSFTGTIYTGNTGAADSNAGQVTAVANGRVNINSITRRSDATSGSAGLDTITKTGAGIVALTGTSNYSGQTTVSAGTLLVNGALSATSPNAASVGTVVVSTAARLGGTGTINRAVTIQNGGILSAGDVDAAGISLGGKLTLGAGLTLSSTSVLNFDLSTPGSLLDDEISVTGNLTLDGVLNITNLGGLGNGSYKLFDYTGTLTDNTLTFGTTPGGFSYSIDTTSFANAVYVNVTPEPGMASLFGLGLAALIWRRRRPAGEEGYRR